MKERGERGKHTAHSVLTNVENLKKFPTCPKTVETFDLRYWQSREPVVYMSHFCEPMVYRKSHRLLAPSKVRKQSMVDHRSLSTPCPSTFIRLPKCCGLDLSCWVLQPADKSASQTKATLLISKPTTVSILLYVLKCGRICRQQLFQTHRLMQQHQTTEIPAPI